MHPIMEFISFLPYIPNKQQIIMRKVAASFVFIFAACTIMSCVGNKKTASSSSSNKSIKCAAFQEPAASPFDAYEQAPEHE
jgi:ABC-type oligopeptide transport system substrate-binding subunit